MALSDAQQTQIFNAICGPAASQSPFRQLGEGAVWDAAQLWFNDDGFAHPQYVEWAAALGDPVSLAILQEVAGADVTQYPDRVEDVRLAQQVLARIQSPAPPVPVVPTPTPTPVPTPAPVVPTPVPPTPTPTPSIGASGWVGIVGVAVQGIGWLLQESTHVLPPQWAAGVSGLLMLLTALGIYKAPNGSTPAAAPQVVTPPAPPPPLPPAPPAPPAPLAGSVADALAKTESDAEELAARSDALRDDIKKQTGQ